MASYEELWHVIDMRVRENNDISHAEISDSGNVRGQAAIQRIAQIFILEILLERHREKYASVFFPLTGEEALHHLVFKRTGWRPFEAKSLSLSDAMFVIAELFREENLPSDAVIFIREQGIKNVSYPVHDFSEKDWDPRENAVFLKQK
ncbi:MULTISPECIES: hypothetical protein [Erwinia]|uniref:ECs1072 family phage-associated protein n=1 Tax=Erwinia TaxID=551 RepID=UPI00055222AD|nr:MULTISPECIES: hypothetical protein [Erwinia]